MDSVDTEGTEPQPGAWGDLLRRVGDRYWKSSLRLRPPELAAAKTRPGRFTLAHTGLCSRYGWAMRITPFPKGPMSGCRRKQRPQDWSR
jgi:hypothetical protein